MVQNLSIPKKSSLKKVATKCELRLIILFGSQVIGITHPGSDIDIAVLSESGKGIRMSDQLDLISDLTGAFGRDVDLAILDHADPLFLHRVVESGRLLYGSERAFAELRIKAFKKYQDFRPILEMERKFILNHYGVSESRG